MLRKLSLVGVAALLTASVAFAASATATAVLSDSSAGARPVALTITFRTELRCGRLSARSLSVALPKAMHVGASIPRSAARIDGHVVASAKVAGTTLVLRPAPEHGVTCDVIGPGTVRVAFSRAAGLGNPVAAGSYPFSIAATPGRGRWHGRIVVGS